MSREGVNGNGSCPGAGTGEVPSPDIAPAVGRVPVHVVPEEMLRSMPFAATRELGALIGHNFVGEPGTEPQEQQAPAERQAEPPVPQHPQERAIWYQ